MQFDKSHFILFLLIIFPITSLFSDKADFISLGRYELVKHVLKNHKSKEKWIYELRSNDVNKDNAGIWERPSLRFSNQGKTIFEGNGKGKLAIAIEQKIPIGKQNSIIKQIARISSLIKEEEIKFRRLELAKMTEDLWLELSYLGEKKKLLDHILKLNQELRDFLKKKSEKGEVSLLDLSEIELELAILESEILKQKEKYKLVLSNLQELLGNDIKEIIRIDRTEFLNPEITDNINITFMNHPQVIISKYKLERSKLELSSIKVSRLNHMNFEIEWEEENELDSLGIHRERNLGVSLSLPIPLWSEYPGSLKSYGLAIKENEENRKIILYKLRVTGDRLLNHNKNLKKRLKLMDEKVMSRNNNNLNLHKKAFKEGRIDQSRLIRVEKQAYEHRLERLDILKEIGEVYSQWREITLAYLRSGPKGGSL